MASPVKSVGKTLVWILMGLLIVGLMGFGAINFSGTVRSVGSVGDKEIDVNTYARALQNEIRAIEAERGSALTFADAQAAGVDRAVLSRLVTERALDAETSRLGISVSDEIVARQLREISAFQGADGSFDREAYRFAIQNAGLTEAQFEEQLRDETARTMLQAAVLSGNTIPDAYADAIVAYAGETRDFTWAQVDPALLATDLPDPSEEDLKTWYDENIALYTEAAAKAITYAWLTPEMIIDSVEVSEDDLRASYERRDAEFNQPERRLTERLVFADDAAAQAARDSLDAGTTQFETLVENRGLALADVDMGDVAQNELGTAGEAVFGAEVGDIVGPFASNLGPALFRVNGVLPAQVTSFEDAQAALRDDLALDNARRAIEAQMQDLDDRLAGGETLEQIAEATDMQLGQVEWRGQAEDEITGYEAFRSAATALSADDFPEMDLLGDGGIYAMRLDSDIAAQAQPFDEVRDQVAEDWLTQTRTETLAAKAEEMAGQLAGDSTFETLGLDPRSEAGATRGDFAGGVPPEVLLAVFDMAPGEARAVTASNNVLLVRLDQISAADSDSTDAQELVTTLREQAGASISQDLFRAMATDIQSRIGLELNQQAINAVHAQFQ
ncbi:SurA N-terminal domain-containing protein [Primorskyibacter flagellatus]|uniref:peptidylprolyl isomerase n=1 Tax=Primorskyibacter flagellatus TaxID=1387277 RepID=UPI003A8E3244